MCSIIQLKQSNQR